MLLKFRVQNFKSIRDEVELSLIAAPSIKDRDDRKVPLPRGKESGLRVAAIYGANASGKSNLFSAISHFAHLVTQSSVFHRGRGGLPYRPFMLDSKSRERPSEFELHFIFENVRYRYGFAHNAEKVIDEWLVSYPRNQPRMLYERLNDDFNFGSTLKGQNKVTAELTRQDSLFISVAAEKNHPIISPIAAAIRDSIVTTKPDERFSRVQFATEFAEDSASRQRLVALMKMADLGIIDINVSTTEIDEEEARFQSHIGRALQDAFEQFDPDAAEDVDFSAFGDSTSRELNFVHMGKEGGEAQIQPSQESRGTMTFFSYLALILPVLDSGHTLIIDELEASLHPMLAQRIVQIFSDPNTNPNNAQLIFSTHSTGLLRGILLSRDQIWFTEKDSQGATVMYPLTDFHPRSQANIEKGYLQGRFGGIPYLGDTGFLKTSELNDVSTE